MSALDLLHWAKAAAQRAASYLRSAQRPAGPADWTRKASRDFVTEVDRTAEDMIREVLLKEVPGAQIVGEELSPGLATTGIV